MPPKNPPALLYTAAALAIAAVAAALFFLTRDIDYLREMVEHILERAQASRWSFPIVCGLYVLSSAIMFPIIVMNLATAIVFGPVSGFVYSLSGTLLSASVFFLIGRLGRGRGLEKFLKGRKLGLIDRKLRESGVLGIAALRMVPLAPFGIFNMAAGVSSVRFFDYLAGTFIAFWPGGLTRAFVGQSLLDVIRHPSPLTAFYMACGIAAWASVVAALHFLLKKFRHQET